MNSTLTVDTAASTHDLTVLSTVKGELGIDAQESQHDAALASLIRQASGIVATYCNRVFASEIVTETFWPAQCQPQDCLILSRSPVSAIASVTLDDEVIAASEYRIDAASGLLYRLDASGYPSRWYVGKSAIVAYTAGYQLLDGLPYGIERGTVLLIKEYWSGRGRDPRVKSEDVPGVMSVDYWVGQIGTPGELPPDVRALLDPHRRRHVGY
jgi:hypothetical protein